MHLFSSSIKERTFASGPVSQSKLSESFLSGTNSEYVEQMYEAWKKNPTSVHVSWASYFANVEKGLEPGKAFVPPPNVFLGGGQPFVGSTTAAFAAGPSPSENMDLRYAIDSVRVQNLIDAFRRVGHFKAHLDPLRLQKPEQDRRLDYTYYGFTEADFNKEYSVEGRREKFGDTIKRLEKTYCSTIGAQFMHLEVEKSVQCSSW